MSLELKKQINILLTEKIMKQYPKNNKKIIDWINKNTNHYIGFFDNENDFKLFINTLIENKEFSDNEETYIFFFKDYQDIIKDGGYYFTFEEFEDEYTYIDYNQIKTDMCYNMMVHILYVVRHLKNDGINSYFDFINNVFNNLIY